MSRILRSRWTWHAVSALILAPAIIVYDWRAAVLVTIANVLGFVEGRVRKWEAKSRP